MNLKPLAKIVSYFGESSGTYLITRMFKTMQQMILINPDGWYNKNLSNLSNPLTNFDFF